MVAGGDSMREPKTPPATTEVLAESAGITANDLTALAKRFVALTAEAEVVEKTLKATREYLNNVMATSGLQSAEVVDESGNVLLRISETTRRAFVPNVERLGELVNIRELLHLVRIDATWYDAAKPLFGDALDDAVSVGTSTSYTVSGGSKSEFARQALDRAKEERTKQLDELLERIKANSTSEGKRIAARITK
jgi:hypothetical protein